MGILKPCVDTLGFDDRWLMRIGMPVLSMMMPIMLNLDYSGPHEYWLHYVPESFIFVIGFWVFYRIVILKLHKFYPEFKDATKRVAVEVVFIILSAPILKAILSVVAELVLKLCHMNDDVMPSHLQALVNIYLPSALIVALYEAFYYFFKYKESIVENERLEKVHVQTQLHNLRNQINPHFLFNSLNTLMNLIPVNQDQAMDYLSKLSKFYRYSVGAREEMKVPLSKELESAELFAQLLEVRFKDALAINIPDAVVKEYFILPMSLQLLIENAVKHNIVSKSLPLKIDITINHETHYITVRNSLQKKLEAVASTGMGLKNIQERFSYFTEKEIICEQSDGEFIISLPLL